MVNTLRDVTDEALMTAVRERDQANLGLLFERYHVPLIELLRRVTGDRQVAELLAEATERVGREGAISVERAETLTPRSR